VSAELVNLRRVRKAKQRQADAETAAENRLRFGKSKAERHLETAVAAREERSFQGHRRERNQDDANTEPQGSPGEISNGQ